LLFKNELRELRKEKPPKKPALLNILSDEKDKKDDETASEDMMLDSIGCTANVIYMDKKMKKIFVSNAGDSRCVMGKNGKSVEMSIDHKPED
jgi:protein phosphatase 1G